MTCLKQDSATQFRRYWWALLCHMLVNISKSGWFNERSLGFAQRNPDYGFCVLTFPPRRRSRAPQPFCDEASLLSEPRSGELGERAKGRGAQGTRVAGKPSGCLFFWLLFFGQAKKSNPRQQARKNGQSFIPSKNFFTPFNQECACGLCVLPPFSMVSWNSCSSSF